MEKVIELLNYRLDFYIKEAELANENRDILRSSVAAGMIRELITIKKLIIETALPRNERSLEAYSSLPGNKRARGAYQANIYLNNQKQKHQKRFSSAIWNFRKFGGNRGAKFFEEAGFTGEEFNEKFLPSGKFWDDDDMKDKQLDHIIPVSFFGYPLPGDANYLACYGLDNLQLLSAEENVAKGANLDLPQK